MGRMRKTASNMPHDKLNWGDIRGRKIEKIVVSNDGATIQFLLSDNFEMEFNWQADHIKADIIKIERVPQKIYYPLETKSKSTDLV